MKANITVPVPWHKIMDACERCVMAAVSSGMAGQIFCEDNADRLEHLARVIRREIQGKLKA